jgi:hypothetical protein
MTAMFMEESSMMSDANAFNRLWHIKFYQPLSKKVTLQRFFFTSVGGWIMSFARYLLVASFVFLAGPAFAEVEDDARDMNSSAELAHALAILDTMMSEGSNDAVAYELRGDVYAVMGAPKKANAEYEAAAELRKVEAIHLLSTK